MNTEKLCIKHLSTILVLFALLISNAACSKLKPESDDIYADYMVNQRDAGWLRTGEYGQRLYVRKNLLSFIITFSGDMLKGAGFDGIKNLSMEITEML